MTPTMDELRIAGIEAHLQPIREQLNRVIAESFRDLALSPAAGLAVGAALAKART